MEGIIYYTWSQAPDFTKTICLSHGIATSHIEDIFIPKLIFLLKQNSLYSDISFH